MDPSLASSLLLVLLIVNSSYLSLTLVPSYAFLENVALEFTYFSGFTTIISYPFPVVATAPIVPQVPLRSLGFSHFGRLYGSTTTLKECISKEPKNSSRFPYCLYSQAWLFISQCVVEFEQQYYSPSDLELFFEKMGVDGKDTPVTVIGPNDADSPGGGALFIIFAFVHFQRRILIFNGWQRSPRKWKWYFGASRRTAPLKLMTSLLGLMLLVHPLIIASSSPLRQHDQPPSCEFSLLWDDCS